MGVVAHSKAIFITGETCEAVCGIKAAPNALHAVCSASNNKNKTVKSPSSITSCLD